MIWKSRSQSKVPEVEMLKNGLTEYYNFERKHYNKLNKLKECEEIWSLIKTST